ncbi:hypothetical protein AXK59_01940 [Tsukamurella tyrosinosolvens]|nr:hypothetical protein AXK59_01940 [Tsukamurella tyrosinosolvens]
MRSVQGFLDELHAEGKTAATVHQVRKVLSAALTYAMRQELIVRNVARLVELPQYTPREAEHWTPDELVKFLEVAKGDLLYPAFLLLALYGLRRGEVLGIRWCDVDFVQDELHIRQQIQRIGSDLQQVELKTASSRRDEPLLLQAREALLAQREYQTKQRESAAATWRGGDDHDRLVFTTRTGSALESHNLARSFHRICERAGLRRITIHGLRHSNATTQKSLQVHSRDIQAILGHGDVRTTGIYEHVDLASKRAALEKVENLLFDQTDENCRQNCRQDKSDAPELTAIDRPKKTPAPVGQALSLVAPTRLELVTQGSSGVPSSPKTTFATPVGKYVQARRLTPIFGRVAVKIAVKQHVFGDVIFENSEAQLLNSGAATIVRDRDSLAIQMAQARKAAGSPNHMSCPLGHDSEWLLQELTIQLNKPRDLEGAAQMS